ncbi:MAG: Holliday junction branch migration protein RuvA [Firmicutes bacterium]|nr:Holliday junction branch migration protein RuvA [Bacillota bacterium]MDY3659188.1 Holliday junction branch migration protein RuvA [Eubacteriales bacterium]
MINYIVGELVSKSENAVVVENNSVGYEIFVSQTTLSSLPQVGAVAKIYTFLNVREDELSLFGFSTLEEKDMFLKLTSVSGIGPKVALSILSGIRLSDLAVAIKTEDTKLLSSIKGLGKKTAERIVLELKDKISIVGFSEENVPMLNESAIDEATEALIALGVNKNDAYRLARENAMEGDKAEDIITRAFQNLN